MATATTTISLPTLTVHPSSSSVYTPRSHHHSYHPTLSTKSFSSRKSIHFHFNPFERNRQRRSKQLWVTFASTEEVLPSDSQQIVSTTGDDGVAAIIQALLFAAFVALSILTVGVIYLAVQDFFEKREREKLEKEAAANKKNGKKKKKKNVGARDGPRGFGQKIDEDDDI